MAANLVYFINFKSVTATSTKSFPLLSRFCGSSFGNVQQLTSDTNVMYAMFRSDFTVPRNIYTGQAKVNYQLVGFKAQVSAGTSGNSLSPVPHVVFERTS